MRKNTTKRCPRRTEDELLLLDAEATPQAAARIDRALLAWSAYLLQASPKFRARFYIALAQEWTKHMRGVLYENDIADHREKAMCTFNAEVISGLSDAGLKEQFSGDWQRQNEANQEAVAESFANLQEFLGSPRSTERQAPKGKLRKLMEQLELLEYLPENESERFGLETMIAQLEHDAARDEWPDVIGGEEDATN